MQDGCWKLSGDKTCSSADGDHSGPAQFAYPAAVTCSASQTVVVDNATHCIRVVNAEKAPTSPGNPSEMEGDGHVKDVVSSSESRSETSSGSGSESESESESQSESSNASESSSDEGNVQLDNQNRNQPQKSM